MLAFAAADENYQGTNKGEAGAPLKKMFGFQRLQNMAPGEKRTVLFSSTAEDLSVVDAGGSRWLKPRRAWIEIGDVAAPARRELAIEGEDRLLEAAGTWAEAAVEYLEVGVGLRPAQMRTNRFHSHISVRTALASLPPAHQ